MRQLELLAPAKNLECGMAAVDHGADAVYIGASRFGARAAAGNSVSDIQELCTYAHRYGVKVFVTVNTIVYEDELEDTQRLIWDLYRAGADAILVQDMALLKMQLPPIALHASTQTDNRSPEKVNWLLSHGFERVVLARELSIDEIKRIHQQLPHAELEVFVHGALCVSYSGVCYVSQHCFSRSANRGACAQFCRMKFDLIDASGAVIERQRYLLSMKDLSQINHLEELAEAGATSFKIEGRLKDVAYVKNVVAAYSQKLNQLVRKYPQRYCRASLGEVEYAFEPSLNKTFNRGYTDYFAKGRQQGIASFDTPKAMGEYVGKVKELRGNSFNVASTASFANGDGLCFINADRELVGFRVNRAEGNRLFPLKMPEGLKPGMSLYRNNDEAFGKLLAKQTAVRKVPLFMKFTSTKEGVQLETAIVHGGEYINSSVHHLQCQRQQAQKSQRDNINRQLTKLGGTPYCCDEVQMDADVEGLFIPSSMLADLRRRAVDAMMNPPVNLTDQPRTLPTPSPKQQTLAWTPQYKRHSYLYNASNHLSKAFYENEGLVDIGDAFEVKKPQPDEALLMQCRHCIRFSLGHCVKHGGTKPTWKEPLYLQLGDNRRFRLHFNCAECQMDLYAE
ncbi:peptidase U32 family protein [Hoylesella shahii]